MADVGTISALATGGGTLVLAVATFASVRSANRAARAAERALLLGIRPVLVPTRFDDPAQKVGFADRHWLHVDGGRAVVEVVEDVVYLAIPLRNTGSGIAVLDRWNLHVAPGFDPTTDFGDPGSYRRLTRDLYISPGDIGFWQGAIRDRNDATFDLVSEALEGGELVYIDLLYADLEGGQRTVSRFAMVPTQTDGARLAVVGRHWLLDGSNPR
jgi:hypothetical protein